MIGLLVAAAGAAGAAARFLVDGLLRERWGSAVPLPTLVINTSGALLLGALTGVALSHEFALWISVIGTGFCGGYTTFSTAMVEALDVARNATGHHAVLYTALMAVLPVAAAATGIAAGSFF